MQRDVVTLSLVLRYVRATQPALFLIAVLFVLSCVAECV
jgi:hypothetical protein